jgi:penicillin amidase/acyl-homoserine-lactone acylase
MLHGHNANLGWANTVNEPDLVDIYRLEVNPDNEDQYLLDGNWRDFEKSTAEIRVDLWGPFWWTVEREVLRSDHGPVLETPNGFFAVRYAGIGEIRRQAGQHRLCLQRAVSRQEGRAGLVGCSARR